MSVVRGFRRRDIGAVADLWMKVFRHSRSPASEALKEYFRDMFFAGPWHDPQMPSLVFDEPGRGVTGFLGVIPRRMKYGDRTLRVAVASQLMVDEEVCPAFAAARLMRGLFAGPQDLAMSDGANEAGAKLWQACGGDVAMLHSLTWTRVLRPAQYARLRLAARRRWGALAVPLGPLGRLFDAGVELSGLGRYWRPSRPDAKLVVREENLTEERLLWCLRHLTGKRMLTPDYDERSLRWLLAQAAEKRNHGRLHQRLVCAEKGAVLGWYLCYASPGQVAQVLQYGCRPEAAKAVLNRLFASARAAGAVAVTGAVDPRLAHELASSRCVLSLPNYGVLMHSKQAELLDAIHRGDAWLSRLEGEWWARFSDRDWSSGGAASRPRITRQAFGRAPRLKTAPSTQ